MLEINFINGEKKYVQGKLKDFSNVINKFGDNQTIAFVVFSGLEVNLNQINYVREL